MGIENDILTYTRTVNCSDQVVCIPTFLSILYVCNLQSPSSSSLYGIKYMIKNHSHPTVLWKAKTN